MEGPGRRKREVSYSIVPLQLSVGRLHKSIHWQVFEEAGAAERRPPYHKNLLLQDAGERGGGECGQDVYHVIKLPPLVRRSRPN